MKINLPLPHNLESEQIVLGSVLIHGELIIQIQSKLKTNDFYRDSHKTLFDVYTEMSRRNIYIDISTVWDYIKSKNIEGEINDITYLTHLIDIV